MDHRTTDHWDEALWAEAEPVYHEGFPEHGRKPRAIVRRMFERGLCTLHIWREEGVTAAMAMTAFDSRAGLLVIDYLAVRQSLRGQGIGRHCIVSIREWVRKAKPDCRGIVIEVEAEETRENANRIAFWEKAGFELTDYVHAYIWVPETYRAMLLNFDEERPLTDNGKELFKAITRYHEKAYRGGNKE